jgi:hypothetical protein
LGGAPRCADIRQAVEQKRGVDRFGVNAVWQQCWQVVNQSSMRKNATHPAGQALRRSMNRFDGNVPLDASCSMTDPAGTMRL